MREHEYVEGSPEKKLGPGSRPGSTIGISHGQITIEPQSVICKIRVLINLVCLVSFLSIKITFLIEQLFYKVIYTYIILYVG